MNTLRRRRRDERQQLVEWRRQYLDEVGVDAELASAVAGDLRWDLHALLQLLERGCPPRLAARILQPDDEGRSL
jgi:Glu-tRNA(Gln) amidotransferase subunit E-like FAD-binding protein